MLEQVKKNWFVLAVAIVLLFVTGFYIKDQTKSVVRNKKVDGKQVVFSIAGENFFADDYQKLLDEKVGDQMLYQLFEREVFSNLETSEDIKSDAKLRANSTLEYIKQSEGAQGVENLGKQLVALGYEGIDSLTEYFENLLKYQELVTNHFMDNYDRLFKKYVDENQPRQVSHILVKFETKGKPTEDELKKIESVDKALKDGKPFNEVAAEYSDDTESKKVDGSLGVVDAKTNFVPEFKAAMMKLKKGEVSDWVETDYGRHLIKVDETNFETLLKSDSEFFEKMTEENNVEVSQAIWDASKKIGFEFVGEGVEDRLIKILGIKKEAAK